MKENFFITIIAIVLVVFDLFLDVLILMFFAIVAPFVLLLAEILKFIDGKKTLSII